jgi:hypothetical protein
MVMKASGFIKIENFLTSGVSINIFRKIMHQIIGYGDRIWKRGLIAPVLQYIK